MMGDHDGVTTEDHGATEIPFHKESTQLGTMMMRDHDGGQ